jgi:hypothetical protein
MSIRVGFMSPKAGGMVIRWRQMRGLWTYHQGPVFVMAIRIANPGIQHQITDEDIHRRINAWKGSPTDWHVYLSILQHSKDMLKRMLTDPTGLLSRIFGEQLCQ